MRLHRPIGPRRRSLATLRCKSGELEPRRRERCTKYTYKTIMTTKQPRKANLLRFADCVGAGLRGLRLSRLAVLVAQGGPLIGAGVGPLQSERGFAQYSGVHACAMLSSLVAPHGSTLFWRNEHERLQENPRRDRRRRHARRNRPRLHPGLRQWLWLQ